MSDSGFSEFNFVCVKPLKFMLKQNEETMEKLRRIMTKQLLEILKAFQREEILIVQNKRLLVDCRVTANCPLVGPRPVKGVPFVGVFLRDPSPYLSEFRRKPRKTRNG